MLDRIIVTRHLADSAVTPAKLLAGGATTWPWQSWTPTLSNGAGSITGTINYAKYMLVGKTVHIRVSITINTVSAAGGFGFSGPLTSASTNQFVGAGREDNTTGSMTEVAFKGSATQIAVLFYNNAGNTATAGYSHLINGTYEAA